MTALVYPPLQENMTVSDHRHATVRWARRALRPDTAVIIGMGTTTPGKRVADRDRSHRNRSHHSAEYFGQPEDTDQPGHPTRSPPHR